MVEAIFTLREDNDKKQYPIIKHEFDILKQITHKIKFTDAIGFGNFFLDSSSDVEDTELEMLFVVSEDESEFEDSPNFLEETQQRLTRRGSPVGSQEKPEKKSEEKTKETAAPSTPKSVKMDVTQAKSASTISTRNKAKTDLIESKVMTRKSLNEVFSRPARASSSQNVTLPTQKVPGKSVKGKKVLEVSTSSQRKGEKPVGSQEKPEKKSEEKSAAQSTPESTKIKLTKENLIELEIAINAKSNLPQWVESYEKKYDQFVAAIKMDSNDKEMARFRKIAHLALLEVFKRHEIVVISGIYQKSTLN
jgi:hypothetical protein